MPYFRSKAVVSAVGTEFAQLGIVAVDGYKVLRVSAKSTRHWIQEQLGRDCSQVGVASAPAERVIMVWLDNGWNIYAVR
jgi:hypothetical protein